MLINTLESYPRDELFQIDAACCARIQPNRSTNLVDRPRVRVLPRVDQLRPFRFRHRLRAARPATIPTCAKRSATI
jgi:NAD-specific glutamate dehydrogenase